MRVTLIFSAVALTLSGCSVEATGCRHDYDCVGDRVCVERRCVNLSEALAHEASSSPPPSSPRRDAHCGDGHLAADESCDESANAPCPDACTPPDDACYDSELVGSADRCDATCIQRLTTFECMTGDRCCPPGCHWGNDRDCATCGDGIVDPGEECDDGNEDEHDRCSSTCLGPREGNGVLERGEHHPSEPVATSIDASRLWVAELDSDPGAEIVATGGLVEYVDGAFVQTGTWVGEPVAVGDIDGDGSDDVITVDDSGQWRAAGGPGATDVTAIERLDGRPDHAALGHFDGDDMLDLLILSGTTDVISVWPGDGAGQFAPPSSTSLQTATSGDAIHTFDLGDFDRDGHADLIYSRSGEVVVRHNDGAAQFETVTYRDIANDPFVALADMDGDDYLDVLQLSANPVDSRISYNSDGLRFDDRRATGEDEDGFAGIGAAGHLDADEALDLVTAVTRLGVTELYLGPGQIRPPRVELELLSQLNIVVESLILADVNGDCIDDVVVGTTTEVVAVLIDAREGHRCDD